LEKTASVIILALLLAGVFHLRVDIQPAQAAGTIHIRADGSIDPLNASISSIDQVTYTMTGNINDSIAVERGNIIIDGAQHIIQGTGAINSKGIDLTERSNVTVVNVKIQGFYDGVWLAGSSNISILKNNIETNLRHGISVSYSSYNNITANNVTANGMSGVWLAVSSNYNSISKNSIADNLLGISLSTSLNNTISGNTFTNDGLVVEDSYENVVKNNTVNGKPLVFLEAVSGYAVAEAGQVVLVNCNNVQVKNLTLSNATVGIELWRTNKSNIVSNSMTANRQFGIDLRESSNNNISGNSLTLNDYACIRVDGSSNNTIVKNRMVNNGQGVWVEAASNNNIRGNTVTKNQYGVRLHGSSSSNTISGNNITASDWANIRLDGSSNNSIIGNTVTNSPMGIHLKTSSDCNSIAGNTMKNNSYGVWLELSSSSNKIYHNNFMDDNPQIYINSTAKANSWDDGYPSGGNYWCYYKGVDLCSGLRQDEAGSDGIGDQPRTIDVYNTDNYPLMAPCSVLEAGSWNGIPYDVTVVSNSTISSFEFNPDRRLISFNVTSEDGASGFCRVAIPKSLLWVENESWSIWEGNGRTLDYTMIADENSTFLYFGYSDGTKTVQITGTNAVPELSLTLVLPLFTMLALFTTVLRKRHFPRRIDH
jgi:parallel beta-helix repeat protein